MKSAMNVNLDSEIKTRAILQIGKGNISTVLNELLKSYLEIHTQQVLKPIDELKEEAESLKKQRSEIDAKLLNLSPRIEEADKQNMLSQKGIRHFGKDERGRHIVWWIDKKGIRQQEFVS